jgi:hypothetical protein
MNEFTVRKERFLDTCEKYKHPRYLHEKVVEKVEEARDAYLLRGKELVERLMKMAVDATDLHECAFLGQQALELDACVQSLKESEATIRAELMVWYTIIDGMGMAITEWSGESPSQTPQ